MPKTCLLEGDVVSLLKIVELESLEEKKILEMKGLFIKKSWHLRSILGTEGTGT